MKQTSNQSDGSASKDKSGAMKGAAGGAFLVGVVLFAVTQNPVWLAIGVAIGAGTATTASKTQDNNRNDNPNS